MFHRTESIPLEGSVGRFQNSPPLPETFHCERLTNPAA
jgi:hypothetical protein